MSISLTEIIVVYVVALLLFGPEQLPVLARGIGKVAGDLKRTSNSLRREFYNSVYTPAAEIKRDITAEGHSLRALKAEVLSAPSARTAAPKPSTAAEGPAAAPSADANSCEPSPPPPAEKP